MTETGTDNKPNKRKRPCLIAIGVFLFLILLVFIICLILALTVFKAKQPRTSVVSASVDGVAQRLSFPAVKIELNITVDLVILIENRNHASFKHGTGKSLLLYRGAQVGDADLYPGDIPARANSTLPARLTMQAHRLASKMSNLVTDALSGEFVIETKSSIPGRITFLGFIKKHAVAESECQLTIGFPNLKVKSQVCKSKTKL
ncbi:putative Late embryogenesis abundant protein, LEA-14 [Rosa chinensis]|uniref:Putative Late embryogenesis abundant protein, LEA-14 n=1 Tax=Rosa chinensis TaxID=74649 RepID=A0A2P6R871_ROSCH|nr:uncharacterized protein LOC112192689 [Rosa chinensis]PRQ42625.1 putative Late embryogenesis abundant protein, LEA-14 [Rosa chinensis]